MAKSAFEQGNLALEDFPFQTFDKLRYGDTDRQGHVNNAVFSTFLETGRIELLFSPQSPLVAERATFVIVKLDLNYLMEINWPGRVEIGTAVTKIGNSSVNFYQGLFQNGRCVATAETVIVQMNEQTRKSHPLTAKAKAFLMQHQLA
ncbi:MAG: acyl-CoA thioesterase [Ardenticatenaceae bacterium]|nr:acyl-CoA thioesterase [Ardenticatenaceae bacterium]